MRTIDPEHVVLGYTVMRFPNEDGPDSGLGPSLVVDGLDLVRAPDGMVLPDFATTAYLTGKSPTPVLADITREMEQRGFVFPGHSWQGRDGINGWLFQQAKEGRPRLLSSRE